MKRCGKLTSIVLIVLCFAILWGGGLWILFGKHQSISERENRALATAPRLSARSIVSGRFGEGLAAYCRDHIPFRTGLISLYGISQLLLGRRECNGILIGKDGFLIPKPNRDEEVTRENLRSFLSVLARCDKANIPCHLFLAPRGADVLTDVLPDAYRAEESNALLSEPEQSVPYCTALTQAFLQAEETSALYYKTDHHWTTDGAYLAYQSMGEFLGYTPKQPDYFDRVTVSTDFLGTSDSKVCLPFPEADEVVLYRYDSDITARVENVETGTVEHSFYVFSALEEKDQYKIFLGGNFARLSIRLEDGTARPRMLLIKDSYANALLPFLALHYELDVIDPRYGSLSSLEPTSYDRVLVLCGADTFGEHQGFFAP